MTASLQDSWQALAGAYRTMVRQRPTPDAVLRLDAAIEGLYGEALHTDGGLPALRDLIVERGDHSVVAAWLSLLDLARCGQASFSDAAAQRLSATLAAAPPRTAWLVGAEIARRLVQNPAQTDHRRAWSVIASLHPHLDGPDWQREGPLGLRAVLVYLHLAATTGHWAEHDGLADALPEAWRNGTSWRAVRVRIALANSEITRARYRRAWTALEAIAPCAEGDLVLELVCAQMHALVAVAERRERTNLRARVLSVHDRWREHAPRWRNGVDPDARRLAPDELEVLCQRYQTLVRRAGLPCDDENADENDRDGQSAVAALLSREARARRMEREYPDQVQAQRNAFGELRDSCQQLLGGDDPQAAAFDPTEWMQLRLLWCRLIVDLHHDDQFDMVEQVLQQVIDEAAALGMATIEMNACDQRAVLRSRAAGLDAAGDLLSDLWHSALEDAGRASEIAVRILKQNASDGSRAPIMDRALLRGLLPVIDRVILLLVEGALAIHEPCGRSSADSDRGSWTSFGQAIHDYAEHAQALALQEARRAYRGGGDLVPHRFAAPGDVPRSLLPKIRDALRPGDAVLQYFVAGRYVIAFAYGCDFFDWHASDLPAEHPDAVRDGEATAHCALESLIAAIAGWQHGGSEPEAARALADALLPEPLIAALAAARHLRIVPHDLLYRVPFGRLLRMSACRSGKMSLSLHPTGTLAGDCAAKHRAPAKSRRLRCISGPKHRYAEAEMRAVERAAGRIAPLAEVSSVASQALGRERALADLGSFDAVHLAGHGRRPRPDHGIEASLAIGKPGETFTLSQVFDHELQGCGLIVLQACWTGWMEHEREHPVHGFPQALCDAGAGAVIAPLIPVPQALAPVFAEVFYRALRFLPAERALHRALEVLRTRGKILAARDDEALEVWLQHGSMDAFDYRYVGATELHLSGGWLARLVGRLSFAWWRWRLR